jgi:hypothetical protein
MDQFREISTNEAVGSLFGMVRVDSGGAEVLEIQLNGRHKMYGRWDAIIKEDDTFSINIFSFGYDNPYNVENEHIDARSCISKSEETALRDIIYKLFYDAYSRETIFPFNVDDIKFDGNITYSNGWIISV